jgi:putative flippase GtrA
VSLLSRWYRRFRQLIHEGAKFGVVGGIGFVVTEAGFNLLHYDAGAGLFTANAIATLAATVVTFLGNRYWTFRHREGHGTARESVMFFVLNGVGLLIQYASVEFAKEVMGVPASDKVEINVAYLFGIALATLFRFWSYRKWVWFAQPAPAPLGPPEAREPVMVPPAPSSMPVNGTQAHPANSTRPPAAADLGVAHRAAPRHSRPR